MRSYTIKEIQEALHFGIENRYQLLKEFWEFREKKEQNPTQTQRMLKELKCYAEGVKEAIIPQIDFNVFIEYRESGNRKHYESAYFEARKVLFSLILIELYEDEGNYIKAIENHLWAWSNMYTWELPAHIDLNDEAAAKREIDKNDVGLFAAETAFFFSEAMHLLKGKLHPFLCERIQSQIDQRVIAPFLDHSFHWEIDKGNWSSVCSGSIGAAAIYSIDDVDQLAIIIHRVLKSMEFYLLSFDEDGITNEGISYWCYGFGFYVYFAQLLCERTSGKINLMDDAQIRTIALYPTIMQFPCGQVISYSDCGSGYTELSPGLLHKLIELFNMNQNSFFIANEPNIYNDPTYRFAVMLRDLIWQRKYVEAEAREAMEVTALIEKGKFFTSSQWGIFKSQKKDGFYCIAAKGGHNDEPHNHNDVGNFILHWDGVTFITDLGAPEYTKDYFSTTKRYETFNATSGAHNLPLIDKREQCPGKDHSASIVLMENTESTFVYTIELKKAYSIIDLLGFQRRFEVVKKSNTLSIKDKFEFSEGKHQIIECFITRIEPKIVRTGQISLTHNHKKLLIEYDPRVDVNIEHLENKSHSGQWETIYRIQLSQVIETHDNTVDVRFRGEYDV